MAAIGDLVRIDSGTHARFIGKQGFLRKIIGDPESYNGELEIILVVELAGTKERVGVSWRRASPGDPVTVLGQLAREP